MMITYLHHSGFLVESDTCCLLFDYYTENGKMDFLKDATFSKPLYTFVSHRHGDHFDPAIFSLPGKKILSNDIFRSRAPETDVVFVKPHETIAVDDLKITTLRSNDEGVAYLVEADGKTIFHAGDLNWWHWNGEPDSYNDGMAHSFCGEIDRLRGRTIDVACLPLDPRLEDKFDWGIRYFAKQVDAKAIFPMHFWGDFRVCDRIEVPHFVSIHRPNESFIR